MCFDAHFFKKRKPRIVYETMQRHTNETKLAIRQQLARDSDRSIVARQIDSGPAGNGTENFMKFVHCNVFNIY